MAERLRAQICEGQLIQAIERARAGLRGDDEPLDIPLYTDVAIPELGPIEPMLWEDIEVGLDRAMLATGGVWLDSPKHAAKAYPGLLTAEALQQARKRAGGGGGTFLIGNPYWDCTSTSPRRGQFAGTN